ncbi:MAG: hypothetical protein ACXV5Q_03530 [Frankiaceae bacterium]
MIRWLDGLGFTWDHDGHLYWRRAKSDRMVLGSAAEHRAAVADLVLDRAARLGVATAPVGRPHPPQVAGRRA